MIVRVPNGSAQIQESALSQRLNQRAKRLGKQVLFSSHPNSLGLEDLRKFHQPVVLVQDYLPDTPIGKVLEQSYDSMLRYKPTLAIGHYPDSGKALILSLEKGISPVNNFESLTVWLDKLLQSRVSHRHYDTDTHLKKVSQMPESIKADLDELKNLTETWSNWSLFPKFQLANNDTGVSAERYVGARFGFVAKNTEGGTLITARGSNKGKPSDKDFALVTQVNGKEVHTTSLERKASLNAPLAHQIFQHRPEIKYIVHSHVFLAEGITVPNISSPDTEEDWESIETVINSGAQIINQPQHGTLILLKNPDELLPILLRNNVYSTRGEAYEEEYLRFLEEDFLARSIAKSNIRPDAKVLDLCCGTGASTEDLRKLGFSHIDIADGSKTMLEQAERKIGKAGKIISLPNLDPLDNDYDLISMRQAFNYVKLDDLNIFAKNIAAKLNEQGKFVFTTFAKLEPGLRIRENTDWQDSSGNHWIRTSESNIISAEQVMHTQRTESLDFKQELWSPRLDINIFYQYSAKQIEQAFKDSGFKVSHSKEANRLCFTCVKDGRK